MTAGAVVDHISKALVGHGVALIVAVVILVLTSVVVAVVMRGRGEERISRATARIFPRVWYGFLALVIALFGVLAYVNNR